MKHGGNIYKVSKELGCKSEEIVDFSSNINAFHPKTEIIPTQEMILKYADPSYSSLKAAISKKYGVKKREMKLFNGATAAIFELFRSLKREDVVLYAPLYSEYETAALAASKKISKINRFEELYKKPKKKSIVVFVNPSTPEGKFYDLKALFGIWEKQKCTIVLDESFVEFENLPSFREKIRSYKRLYIIHSFTKFHACAGVRIGALFSNEKNIQRLSSPRWALSSFDAVFLTERLQEKAFVSKAQKKHLKHKEMLFGILQSSGLFSKIYPGSANFFLTRSPQAQRIYDELLKQKLLVRQCGNFDFLGEEHLRFAVKERASLDILKKAFYALA
jgi:threonine-phosphate decarboxylase